jgi:hypothetical protein
MTGVLVCCSCPLDGTSIFTTRGSMITHLIQHIRQGHKVPSWPIQRLLRELREDGNTLSLSHYYEENDANKEEK